MIVRQEWSDDGNAYWKRTNLIRYTQGEMLRDYRNVPSFLWKAYTATLNLLAVLGDRIQQCDELPEYVSYREDRDRHRAIRAKFEREAEERYARDVAAQDEIRRAGQLTPLLKDCPTDEPVRIKSVTE